MALDAARFVGRSAELAQLDGMLGGERSANIVMLHGPAGVGKSALMRAFARRAQLRGWTPVAIEARDLPPLTAALDSGIAPALAHTRPLVLLDSWERMSALDSYLRANVLSRLPTDAIVVVGSRRGPARGWFTGGWENVVVDLKLVPLDHDEASALLARRGIDDPAARAAAITWAGGSPLALVLLARAAGAAPRARTSGDPDGVVEELLRRVLDAEAGEQRTILAVAAVARITTPALLAAALPGVDADAAFAWLRGHPSAEPLRDGITLHDLVGRVLRADLRRRSPELDRDLRRRIVDALYAESCGGGLLQLTLDLQHLVQDPAIRWGFSWDDSGRYRIDTARKGDLEAIRARAGRAAISWLDGAARYFVEAPQRVTVVRDQDDVIAGYGVGVTPDNAPAFAHHDPVLGPRIVHARAHVPDRAALIWRQAVDMTHDHSSPVVALIGMSGVLGSGLENPAAAYLPIAAGDAAAAAFSAACRARPVPELSAQVAGASVECHVLDYGPGGLLGFQRAAVYRELGLPPLATNKAPDRPLTLADVRGALRRYRSPALLAAGPLAPTEGSPADRAQRARDRIDQAVQDAFGRSPADRRLHAVLVRAYLDPAATHELAAAELNLSRTAYFRRLRIAVARVAAQLGCSPTRH